MNCGSGMFCYVCTFTLKLMSVQKSVVSFWFWKPSIWVKCVGGGMVRGEVTNLLWSLFEHFRKVWLQAEAWSKICRSTYTILLHIESLQNKKCCCIQSNIAIPKLTFGYVSHVFCSVWVFHCSDFQTLLFLNLKFMSNNKSQLFSEQVPITIHIGRSSATSGIYLLQPQNPL